MTAFIILSIQRAGANFTSGTLSASGSFHGNKSDTPFFGVQNFSNPDWNSALSSINENPQIAENLFSTYSANFAFWHIFPPDAIFFAEDIFRTFGRKLRPIFVFRDEPSIIASKQAVSNFFLETQQWFHHQNTAFNAALRAAAKFNLSPISVSFNSLAGINGYKKQQQQFADLFNAVFKKSPSHHALSAFKDFFNPNLIHFSNGTPNPGSERSAFAFAVSFPPPSKVAFSNIISLAAYGIRPSDFFIIASSPQDAIQQFLSSGASHLFIIGKNVAPPKNIVQMMTASSYDFSVWAPAAPISLSLDDAIIFLSRLNVVKFKTILSANSIPQSWMS